MYTTAVLTRAMQCSRARWHRDRCIGQAPADCTAMHESKGRRGQSHTAILLVTDSPYDSKLQSAEKSRPCVHAGHGARFVIMISVQAVIHVHDEGRPP